MEIVILSDVINLVRSVCLPGKVPIDFLLVLADEVEACESDAA